MASAPGDNGEEGDRVAFQVWCSVRPEQGCGGVAVVIMEGIGAVMP